MESYTILALTFFAGFQLVYWCKCVADLEMDEFSSKKELLKHIFPGYFIIFFGSYFVRTIKKIIDL